MLHEVKDDGRIKITAAGPHHQSLQGGEPHTGVDATAPVNSRNTAPVTKMAGYDFKFLQRPIEKVGRGPADVLMACAVETVPANFIFLIKRIWQSVKIGIFRKRGMKSGVENSHLRNTRKDILARFNPFQVRRVV